MPDDNPVNDQRISLFLRKLWTLVNSPETDNVITWNEGGDGFIIKNQGEFCDVLPRYFKHNNFMSFVRQLHIYGFSKRISDIDHSSQYGTSSEYAHPYFMKEHPCLLLSIKQKRGEKLQQNIKTDIDSIETITTLIKEVNCVKDKNKMLDSKFMAMKHENECLWRELAVIRQKHMKQQRILNQLIQFLVTLRQPGTNNTLCREVKNNVRYVLPIMHHKTPEKTNSSETFTNPKYKPSTSSGPVIHELDSADIVHSNNHCKNERATLNEVVESELSEGIVLSPSSVSQMLINSDGSTVEDIFAPNEIMIDSPLDDLIREVSVSPTEELLETQPIMVTVRPPNSKLKKTKSNSKPSKKRTKKNTNKKPIKKIKPENPVTPYTIKVEPSGDDDPPVISIPEMDFIEPEVTILNNDNDLWNSEIISNNDNMQLAHPQNRQVLTYAGNRSLSPNLPNYVFEKEHVSKQIDSVQQDLENLLKGINDKYTFDANMFLNFINDDPTNLNFPLKSEEETPDDAKNGLNVTPDNQIVSCLSPNTYDLNDLMSASADWTLPNTPISFDSTIGNDILNTPLITDSFLNSEPLFPNTTLPEAYKK